MIHFKPNTYPMQIAKRTCDAEIGSVKRGWHSCNRKAVVSVESKMFGDLLDYCKQHAPKPLVLK